MRFMTDAAGATFAIVDHVHVVEILVAVAETGIHGGIGEAQKILFMTVETGSIDAFLVGGINVGGITSPQHPEVI